MTAGSTETLHSFLNFTISTWPLKGILMVGNENKRSKAVLCYTTRVCWWLRRSLFSNHVMSYPNRLTQILVPIVPINSWNNTIMSPRVMMTVVQPFSPQLFSCNTSVLHLQHQMSIGGERPCIGRSNVALQRCFFFSFLCYHRAFRIFFPPLPSIGFELSKILQITHQMLRI